MFNIVRSLLLCERIHIRLEFFHPIKCIANVFRGIIWTLDLQILISVLQPVEYIIVMFLILIAPLLFWLKIESFRKGFNEIYEFFFRAFKFPTRRVFYITNKRVNHLFVFLIPLLFYRFAIYCCFVLINGLQFILCISQQGLSGIRDKALAILVFPIQYWSKEMWNLVFEFIIKVNALYGLPFFLLFEPSKTFRGFVICKIRVIDKFNALLP